MDTCSRPNIHRHRHSWIQAVRQTKQTQTHMGTCVRPCKHTRTRTGMNTSSQDRLSRHKHTKIHAVDHASIHKHEQAWIQAVRQTKQTQTKDRHKQAQGYSQTDCHQARQDRQTRTDGQVRQTRTDGQVRHGQMDRWTSQTDTDRWSDGQVSQTRLIDQMDTDPDPGGLFVATLSPMRVSGLFGTSLNPLWVGGLFGTSPDLMRVGGLLGTSLNPMRVGGLFGTSLNLMWEDGLSGTSI